MGVRYLGAGVEVVGRGGGYGGVEVKIQEGRNRRAACSYSWVRFNDQGISPMGTWRVIREEESNCMVVLLLGYE